MARATALVLWFLLGVLATAVESGKPDLYYFLPSPPCRTVLMTARVLGSDINLKVLNVAKGEQFTPEYLKVNPQHTVPALDDNGFTLSESRAIAGYLATISPNGENLYPKDPKKRSLIDQMMYFDLDKLYSRMLKFFVIDTDATPMVLGAPYDQRKAELLDAAFAMLEEYLSRNTYAAGNNMTLADITLLTTVSMAEIYDALQKHRRYMPMTLRTYMQTTFKNIFVGVCLLCPQAPASKSLAQTDLALPPKIPPINQGCGYEVAKYPKVNDWLAKMKSSIPDYKALNEDGIQMWINANWKKPNQTRNN